MAGNRLAALPRSLAGLQRLQTLSLLGNQLERVPDTLGTLGALRELWLQGNPGLGELPEDLDGLAALAHASFADCALTRVPPALFRLPSLRTVSLYGNRLTMLPAETLQQVHIERLPIDARGERARGTLGIMCWMPGWPDMGLL